MLTRRSLLLMCFLIFMTAAPLLTTVCSAGTLVEDFEDGDAEGWERSPQNGDNDNVFWGVVDGAMMFDPQGEIWSSAIGQMNFVGTPQIPNVADWTDYEVEVDIKHTEMAN